MEQGPRAVGRLALIVTALFIVATLAVAPAAEEGRFRVLQILGEEQ